MNKNIDGRVLELFNQVREKKKGIAISERVSYLTNMSFGYTESLSDRVNLHTVATIEKLVDIYAFLLQKKEYNEKASKLLNQKSKSFKWLGYDLDKWMEDVKTKIGQLGIEKEKAELSNLEKRLDSLITIDQRREMELEAIEKEIKGE